MVRQRSAKPPFTSSNLVAASNILGMIGLNLIQPFFYGWASVRMLETVGRLRGKVVFLEPIGAVDGDDMARLTHR